MSAQREIRDTRISARHRGRHVGYVFSCAQLRRLLASRMSVLSPSKSDALVTTCVRASPSKVFTLNTA
jgi:hypothetical protein